MLNPESIGKSLILGGVFLSLFGLAILFHQKIPFVGRLPGDIFLQRGSISFFFPVMTCLILSAALTLVVNLLIGLLHR
jgi:hypothetical protein